MNLEPYEYRDPGEIVAAIASQQVFEAGDVLLAVICDPSTDQAIEHVTKLDRGDWEGLDHWQLAQYLASQVRQLPIPPRGNELRHSVLTIVVRRGFTVFGRDELQWMYAWRWSNHMVDTFSSDIVLVTEHGWCDLSTGWGDHEPRLMAPSTSAANAMV